MRWHNFLIGVAVVVAVAATGTAAFGATQRPSESGARAQPAASRVSVAVARSSLGRILVDGRGRTLYLFEKDRHGKSSCNGSCAGSWPPLIASGKPLATKGAKASLLGSTRRADGRLQVTYNHHPLYRFVEDRKPGQTNGEAVDAFGGEWYAVSSGGTKVEQGDAGGGGAAPGGYGSYGGY